MNNQDPRFKHDCNSCIFLGQYNEYDLYFCPPHEKASKAGGSLIARDSDRGQDYTSKDTVGFLCGAARELAFGISNLNGDGSTTQMPPRQGNPLAVAFSRVIEKDLLSILFF